MHHLCYRHIQDIRRLGDVRTLPGGHDDHFRGRDGFLVVLVVRYRLHGHAHGRGHERRWLHGLPGGHDDRVRRLDRHLVLLVVRRGLLGNADCRGRERRGVHPGLVRKLPERYLEFERQGYRRSRCRLHFMQCWLYDG
jgi:hypothetical protein